MYKIIIKILSIIVAISLSGCAWENLPEGETETQHIIQVTMRLGGAMRQDLFYYVVFNLSGDPVKKPYSVFEGEDRGKYWTVYYMWGKPPNEDLGLYRGRGWTNKDGVDLIDEFPTKEDFLNELLPGTSVEGDHMVLHINLTELNIPNNIINLNMIVCNQAIDAQSRFEYEYDPYVFDSFMDRGISINLESTADFWNETHNPMEEFPNEHENVAPPEADIVNWRVQVISD